MRTCRGSGRCTEANRVLCPQITDISQLGSIGDVAKLILPQEVQVLAAGEVTIPQQPRDTGTVRGVVNTPPQTIYR